LIRDVLHIVVI